MSNLDKKLEKYVLNVYAAATLKDSVSSAAFKAVYGNIPLSPKEYDELMESVQGFAGEVKHAFLDDGWVRIPQVELERHPNATTPTLYTVNGKEVLAKEEWERQAVKDGWRRCIDPNDHAHWLETDTVSSNIRPDFVGPDAVLPHSNLSDEQLDAISEEWSKPRMTGQEWYDRFTYQLNHVGIIGWNAYTKRKVLAAAKKAAGIE